MVVEKAIKQASKVLKNNKVISSNLDAEIILANIMGVEREFFIINNKVKILPQVIKKYKTAIKKRIKHEPVAYITGKKEFWSEDFLVNYSTLIPRPETELLIYKVINFLKGKKISILDIGTGSGCILLSILKELKLAKGIGIDISKKTIKTAEQNARNLNLNSRSKFKAINLNEFSAGFYDLIISNPPYIPSKDIKYLSKDIINYEPLVALDGGDDGLDLIKKVIYKSKHLLKKSGLLAIEIGNNQYQKVSKILRNNGFSEKSKEYDYKNNVRCIISTKVKFI
jgi:release factor glutamine methyltransferase